MNKFYKRYFSKLIITLFLLSFIAILSCKIEYIKKKRGYSLFIEFSNAHGIKKGTHIYFRGIQIGSIKNIYMKVNSVIVVAYINSLNILIPKNSLVETNQTGLFNDTIIDIVPLKIVDSKLFDINIFSSSCLKSNFLCNHHYLKGYRGLNYDDLIRAATRISQRFDDPRFFSLFYIFLQNNIDISDEFLDILNTASNFLYIFLFLIKKYFITYLN
uniref:Mce/MlaD domain-containing protein n=1 Tax=Caloglossa monosticha TaxID=76906 RepID=A0A1Z1M4K8_9FLOR|nr:hypothetical protein [Caloglossa monosticha]ARW60997.1 hypothetical protein [Caloglossa monosticha]